SLDFTCSKLTNKMAIANCRLAVMSRRQDFSANISSRPQDPSTNVASLQDLSANLSSRLQKLVTEAKRERDTRGEIAPYVAISVRQICGDLEHLKASVSKL